MASLYMPPWSRVPPFDVTRVEEAWGARVCGAQLELLVQVVHSRRLSSAVWNRLHACLGAGLVIE